MKNNMSYNSMNKKDLKKLSKSELIQMIQTLLKPNTKPVPAPRAAKPIRPIPAARKSVQQMVRDYEENIIPPPLEFRDGYKPVPAPRTKRQPVPLPRTKIEQTDKALKGFTKSYNINVKNKKDPLVQLQNTRKAIANHIENMLISMKGLKFVETIKVTFTKMSNGEIVYKTAYFNSPAQTIINNTEIDKALEVSKQGY